MTGGYTRLAEQQIDEIEDSGDIRLLDEVLRTCGYVLDHPGDAAGSSGEITSLEGLRFKTPVPGHRHKVFWYREDDPDRSPVIVAVIPAA